MCWGPVELCLRVDRNGACGHGRTGRAVLAVARELGLPRLRVAVVTGDDVLPWLQQQPVPLLDSPLTSADLADHLICANAYLGADALLPALASGAEVVITGRVADPALFLAPLMHAFGWRGSPTPAPAPARVANWPCRCWPSACTGWVWAGWNNAPN